MTSAMSATSASSRTPNSGKVNLALPGTWYMTYEINPETK